MKKISIFAPKVLKSLSRISGVSIGVTNCGLKKNGKDDLVLVKFDEPSNIFGCFTKSLTPGEPIKWNKKIISHGKVSALLINSGNANVFTGKKGKSSINRIVKSLSLKLMINKKEIYIASTGVIGELLDDNKIIRAIPKLLNNLNNKNSNWVKAANAIRTTDTFPKLESLKIKQNGNKIILNGLAKGSGMIAPRMATMLSFIFTNVKFSNNVYKRNFLELVNNSFNSITVDGDTSTSDMVLFISVESKDNITLKKKEEESFFRNLYELMKSLALQIVKDGEGASKFIEIRINNSFSDQEAKKVAMSIANSPLFKTAISGSDSNWGRIIMAIGKTNIRFNPMKVSMWFGEIKILDKGEIFQKVNYEKLNAYMKNEKLILTIDLALGKGFAKVWTCDLTKEYISINADYRS